MPLREVVWLVGKVGFWVARRERQFLTFIHNSSPDEE